MTSLDISSSLLKRVSALKDKIDAHKSIVSSTCDRSPKPQAGSQIAQWAKDVQSENGQLRAVLEEFLSTMDLLMDKHRGQVSSLIRRQEELQKEAEEKIDHERDRAKQFEAEVVQLTSKLLEMQGVMQLAIDLDTERYNDATVDVELSRLQKENEGLRELLGIAGIPGPGYEDEPEPSESELIEAWDQQQEYNQNYHNQD
eukprot:m.337204 g.337204  ORF g.337204 m.337204 type:complete len:200 (+) comp18074_c0_seq1:92-691(+)